MLPSQLLASDRTERTIEVNLVVANSGMRMEAPS